MDWYVGVLKKYFEFEGRARRKEYWMFLLINFLIAIGITLIGKVIGTGVLSSIYSLAVLCPSLAVSVRRLHDTNRSGWWLLIHLVPIIGSIVFVVFALLDSDPGPNNYGPSPKYQQA